MVGCFAARCCCARCRVAPRSLRHCHQLPARSLGGNAPHFGGNTAHFGENTHHINPAGANTSQYHHGRYNAGFGYGDHHDFYSNDVRDVGCDVGDVRSGGKRVVYDLSTEVLKVFPGIQPR